LSYPAETGEIWWIIVNRPETGLRHVDAVSSEKMADGDVKRAIAS